MTDTTEAPERIWAWEIDHNSFPSGYYSLMDVDESAEYTRTDLFTAVEAERDAHKAENNRLRKAAIDLRDDMLDQVMDIARLAYTGDATAREIADQIDELRAALKEGD